MVEAIKNGKGLPADTPGFAGTGSSSAKSGRGKAAAVNVAASLPQSTSRTAPSSEGANNGEDSTSKLTGKAFHEASKRVNAIERKLAKLEERKTELEAQMAAHDPSDYEGLNKLNEQLTAVNTESDDLEAEWLELSEQLE
nr:ABC transporter C-terminal domain-containing protein [Bifidobacterium longum]